MESPHKNVILSQTLTALLREKVQEGERNVIAAAERACTESCLHTSELFVAVSALRAARSEFELANSQAASRARF